MFFWRILFALFQKRKPPDADLIYTLNVGSPTEVQYVESYLIQEKWIGYLSNKLKRLENIKDDIKEVYYGACIDTIRNLKIPNITQETTTRIKDLWKKNDKDGAIQIIIGCSQFKRNAAIDTYFYSIFDNQLKTYFKNASKKDVWYDDIGVLINNRKAFKKLDLTLLGFLMEKFELTNPICAERLMRIAEGWKDEQFVEKELSKTAGSSRVSTSICREKLRFFIKDLQKENDR
jgi:hypothetical protein